MKNIEELQQLPEPLKREVLDYAEYLLMKYHSGEKGNGKKKWADMTRRGPSKGETGSETVIRMRGEERW